MKRVNIIVMTKPELETWSNFKLMCDAKGLPYHSLKMLPFPIKHKEFEIHKTHFNTELKPV